MPTPRTSADSYEAAYSFMCRNALRRDLVMLHRVHSDWLDGEMRDIDDELERRGWLVIANQEEYNAGVAKYGLPKAFEKDGYTHS